MIDSQMLDPVILLYATGIVGVLAVIAIAKLIEYFTRSSQR